MLRVLGQIVQGCDVQLELSRLAELAKTHSQADEIRPSYRDGQSHTGLGDIIDAVAM